MIAVLEVSTEKFVPKPAGAVREESEMSGVL